jgi:predicted nucleic acid-binding protein
MWVVDTCVVIDVLEDDPVFGQASAKLLQRLLRDGLTICPVTFVELAPAFEGDTIEQKRFLNLAGISCLDVWSVADTEAAHAAWTRYVSARRTDRVQKRPVADLLIGGFAAGRRGLVTRNPDDFSRWFPSLKIRVPRVGLSI